MSSGKRIAECVYLEATHHNAGEYELREPIPHIGLCTYNEPRSSIFKRNVIGQIVKILKTQETQNQWTL